MSLIDDAKTLWQIIRNETNKKANTATRVGNAGLAILDALEEVSESGGSGGLYEIEKTIESDYLAKWLINEDGTLSDAPDTTYNAIKARYSYSMLQKKDDNSDPVSDSDGNPVFDLFMLQNYDSIKVTGKSLLNSALGCFYKIGNLNYIDVVKDLFTKDKVIKVIEYGTNKSYTDYEIEVPEGADCFLYYPDTTYGLKGKRNIYAKREIVNDIIISNVSFKTLLEISNWSTEKNSDGLYEITVYNYTIRENKFIIGSFLNKDSDIVIAAEIQPTELISYGEFKIFAKNIPTEDLTFTYKII